MPTPPPATLFNSPARPSPPGTGTLGMALFLAALFMLFAGTILGYLLIRLGADDAPPMGSIHLPWGLWVSTLVILASSFTIHLAMQAIHYERQTRFRSALTATLLLAVLFLLVQTPSLLSIIHDHLPKLREYQAARDQVIMNRGSAIGGVGVAMPLEGLVFLLILIHALHVIGGVIPLAVVTWRAHQGRYDHENLAPVRYVAMYWHFLDAVWVVMFAVLLIAA